MPIACLGFNFAQAIWSILLQEKKVLHLTLLYNLRNLCAARDDPFQCTVGLCSGLWATTSEPLLSTLSDSKSGWSYEHCVFLCCILLLLVGFPDSFSAPNSGYLRNTQKRTVGINWLLFSPKMKISKKHEYFWPKPNVSSENAKSPRQINVTTCCFVLLPSLLLLPVLRPGI